MAERGVNTCLKLFLIVVNFLFLIVGIAILGVGIYLCTTGDLGKYSDLFAGMQTLRSVRFILIGLGCFIVLIGMCGFFGACRENRCLIIVYLILLFLVLIVNVAAVVLSVVYNKQVKSFVVEQVKDRMKRYYGNITEPVSNSFSMGIDAFQTDEKCCGWTGLGTTNFFLNTPWYQQQAPSATRSSFPDTCCAPGIATDAGKRDKCVKATDEAAARRDGFINADDCSDKLVAVNGRYMHAVLGSVIVAILLQIICIICSVVIVRQISSDSAGRVV